MRKPKFTGNRKALLVVPMTEEQDPDKAMARILHRMRVIYGDGIKMYSVNIPDEQMMPFGGEIQPNDGRT